MFLVALQNSDYNFLLSDYSYLQFTHFDREHYRYAYYPNPFIRAGTSILPQLDSWLAEGVIDFEEYSQFLSEELIEFGAPLIRFEVDCDAYKRLRHPAAHFHIGCHAENRWPSERKLTPLLFSLLITKFYYYESWNKFGQPTEEEDFFNHFDKKFCDEMTNCELLGAELFDDHERRQLHFA